MAGRRRSRTRGGYPTYSSSSSGGGGGGNNDPGGFGGQPDLGGTPAVSSGAEEGFSITVIQNAIQQAATGNNNMQGVGGVGNIGGGMPPMMPGMAGMPGMMM